MKIHKNIFLKIILLLFILFVYGSNVFAYNNIQPYSIEFSADINNFENSLSSDNNSLEDEQIYNNIELSSLLVNMCLIPNSQNCFLISNSSSSVWQPPKI